MPVGNSISHIPGIDNSKLAIWDTQYVPSSQCFDLYRETVCKIYMPWSLEAGADIEFQARIETARVGNGTISRHHCSPHLSVRTARDIANSGTECSYLVRIYAGNLKSEQDNSLAIVCPGDILLLDSSRRTKLSMEGTFDALAVTIPKSELRGLANANFHLSNMVLTQARTPLAKCLNLLGHIMPSSSPEEMGALYDAVLSLLPIEAGYFDHERKTEQHTNISYLLRNILGHIDQNIANTDLTPRHVADQFGISVRYVHRLFVGCGMTFRSYTTARRLESVCKDLSSPSSWRLPISVVAFRWGFNDLSSFNRAFKNRYGCTPSQFRARASM